VVETHTCQKAVRYAESGVTAKTEDGLPRPEGNHETKPAKEENSAIDISKGVEDRNGPSFVVDWVDLGGLPQGSDLEAHCD
jgi:hypothetical protein